VCKVILLSVLQKFVDLWICGFDSFALKGFTLKIMLHEKLQRVAAVGSGARTVNLERSEVEIGHVFVDHIMHVGCP